MTMRIRNVLKEFEAHLEPTHVNGKIIGKSEWKQYGDGTYRFKISIRNIELPDDSRIDVLLDDAKVMQLTVQGGQMLQLKFGEVVLAEGIYKEE